MVQYNNTGPRPMGAENQQLFLKLNELEQKVNGEPLDTSTLTGAKEAKNRELNAACEAVITAGIDVEGEHYSLTVEDQLNLSGLVAQAAQGTARLPYHADGKPCRMYTAEELSAIYTTALTFKTFHVTRCNHLHIWVNRCTTVNQVQEIAYDSTLPDDLQANMDSILGGGGDEPESVL